MGHGGCPNCGFKSLPMTTVPEMPPGYILVERDAGHWRSFGWVLHRDGLMVAARQGERSEAEAARTAFEHAGANPRGGAPI